MAGNNDYFANPKKDDKPRRGRPPGSKNKKTLEAEQKAEKMKKSRMQKNPAVAIAGALAGEAVNSVADKLEKKTYFEDYSIDEKKEIWGAMREYVKSMYSQQDLEDAKDRAEEEEVDLEDMFKDMGFDGSPVDVATAYALTWDNSYWEIDIEKACGGKDVEKSKVKKSWVSNASAVVSQAHYDLWELMLGCPDDDLRQQVDDVVQRLSTLKTDLRDMAYNESQGWDVYKSKTKKTDYIEYAGKICNQLGVPADAELFINEDANGDHMLEIPKDFVPTDNLHFLENYAWDDVGDNFVINLDRESFGFWKSVKFKGYDGTWVPIAVSKHYKMWQSVEMGDKAYNLITKTMKKKGTGELVDKIAYEDVDGFEDERTQKCGIKKSETECAELKKEIEEALRNTSYSEFDVSVSDRSMGGNYVRFSTYEYFDYIDLFMLLEKAFGKYKISSSPREGAGFHEFIFEKK